MSNAKRKDDSPAHLIVAAKGSRHPMLYDRPTLLRAACLLLLGGIGQPLLAADPPPAVPPASAVAGAEFFETHIRPVLVEKCYDCHSGQATVLKGRLRLDSAEHVRTGGESGPVIVPNKPDESLLISALKYESNEMPPSGKLPEAVIDDFERWISMGAPDPRTDVAAADAKNQNPDPREHWAYKHPQKAAPPQVAHSAAARCDIDRFVLAKLETASLSPSAQAPPRALLRRIYYDLTGLPPTAEELDEFAADPSDARYEATVDRLLASPRFGERWARHWLDVARYADTKGYVFTEDRSYKGGYAFRDWVIASFNADRPYDKFVSAQVAADQVDDPVVRAGERFSDAGPAVSQ